MKKIYSFMVAAVAMIAAVSCNKEFSNDNLFGGDVITFRASVDGADTKAVLDGKKSSWEADDKITIINAEKGFEFSASEAGPAVNFCYNNENKDFSGDKFYAVYPASANYSADFDKNTVNAYIPTYQKANLGGYPTYSGDANMTATLAVAYTENELLKFKNACALLKFNVSNTNITHVKFYGNNEEAITGNMMVSVGKDDADETTINSVEGQKTIFTWDDGTKSDQYGTWVEMHAYNSEEDKYFEAGEDKFYYIAVAPVKFTKGFAVKVTIAGQEHEINKYEGEYELKPNTILNIGELKYEEPVAEEFVPQDGFVYLQPNANWNVDNARFAAYFFDNGETWADMTLVEGQTNIYGCQVPAGYENVIFCRMNPSATANSWDNKWNQTSDLKLTDGCLYTVEEGSWDKGNGEWSGDPAVKEDRNLAFSKTSVSAVLGDAFTAPELTGETDGVKYSSSDQTVATVDPSTGAVTTLKAGTATITASAEENETHQAGSASYKLTVTEKAAPVDNNLYLKPNSNWTQANARFAAYFFNNATGKNEWVSMTDADNDGIYEVAKKDGYPNVIFCRMNPGATANNWNNKWNQTADLTVPTDGTNLYTVKENTWDKGGGTWSKK